MTPLLTLIWYGTTTYTETMIEITLTANDANRRFDRFLQAHLSQASKSLVHKLLRKKRIKLNGARAQGNEITAIGDKVTLYLASETYESFIAKPQSAPLKNWGDIDIVYEDNNVLLVNKPAGLLVHSNSPAPQDTLLGRVAYYLQGNQAAPCNRLDRNTSGLVVFGKNVPALQALNAAFANRQVDKVYIALIHGRLEGSGVLKGYLQKDGEANRSYIQDTHDESGQYVHTEYESLTAGDDYSLLKVKIFTGRSHQIRAQFAALGYPLAGDKKYGGKAVSFRRGQMLHCMSLKFTNLDQGALAYLSGKEWQAPVPSEFNR